MIYTYFLAMIRRLLGLSMWHWNVRAAYLNLVNSGCRVTMFLVVVDRSVDFLHFWDYPEAKFLFDEINKNKIDVEIESRN